MVVYEDLQSKDVYLCGVRMAVARMKTCDVMVGVSVSPVEGQALITGAGSAADKYRGVRKE